MNLITGYPFNVGVFLMVAAILPTTSLKNNLTDSIIFLNLDMMIHPPYGVCLAYESTS